MPTYISPGDYTITLKNAGIFSNNGNLDASISLIAIDNKDRSQRWWQFSTWRDLKSSLEKINFASHKEIDRADAALLTDKSYSFSVHLTQTMILSLGLIWKEPLP